MPKTLSPEDIADFQDRLCDAAERLFAESGPDAVTIRQLATDVGVSAMTPYRYFKDKDAILAAVRARAFDRHAEALERAYGAAPDDPIRRAFPKLPDDVNCLPGLRQLTGNVPSISTDAARGIGSRGILAAQNEMGH